MKFAHLILILGVFFFWGCNQNRTTSNCSILVDAAPELEIRVDTIYTVKKYEVKSRIRQSCPVEKVTWSFLNDQEKISTINTELDHFVTIPHRLVSLSSSNVELSITFLDGGQRKWNFPIEDLIAGY